MSCRIFTGVLATIIATFAFTESSEAQLRTDGYWNGYWNWYDTSYRPYYSRGYGRLGIGGIGGYYSSNYYPGSRTYFGTTTPLYFPGQGYGYEYNYPGGYYETYPHGPYDRLRPHPHSALQIGPYREEFWH